MKTIIIRAGYDRGRHTVLELDEMFLSLVTECNCNKRVRWNTQLIRLDKKIAKQIVRKLKEDWKI